MKRIRNSIKYIGISGEEYWLLREREGDQPPDEPGVYVFTAALPARHMGEPATVYLQFANHTEHLNQVWSHLPPELRSAGLQWTVDYSDSVDLMDPTTREDWATDLQSGIVLRSFAA